MRIFWSVAVGGALGCVSRYYLTAFIQQRAGPSFPVGTLIINITGSFLLGFIMRYALQSGAISAETRMLLTSGFCGGYTTFSTYSYETAMMLDDGEYGRAAIYAGTSVVLALAGTFLGFAAANRLLALREGAGLA
jgi:fluoride exporter